MNQKRFVEGKFPLLQAFWEPAVPVIPLHSLRGCEAVLSWTWDSMSSFPVSQAGSGTAIPVTGSFQMSSCQHHSSRTAGHWQAALPSWHKNGPTSNSYRVRELGKTAKAGKSRILQTLTNRFCFAFKLKLLLLAQRAKQQQTISRYNLQSYDNRNQWQRFNYKVFSKSKFTTDIIRL